MAKQNTDQRRREAEHRKAKAAARRVDPAHVIADGRLAEGETLAEAVLAPHEAAVDAAIIAPAEIDQHDFHAAAAGGAAADQALAKHSQSSTADAAALVQQVRTQATQLATHLRRQQGELDHRESQLNARLAGLESQVRSARLWLAERQQELTEHQQQVAERSSGVERREQELVELAARLAADEQKLATQTSSRVADIETREQVLACRIAELAAAESTWKDVCEKADRALTSRAVDLERRVTQLDERQTDLDLRCAQLDACQLDVNVREAELVRRQEELDARASELAQRIAAGERAEHLEQELARLATRRGHLDAAEALLAKEQIEVASQRKELVAKRDELDEQARAERKQLADRQREAEAEVEKKRQSLRRRGDDLEARKSALKQLRGEVSRTQREVLEMRLATEELWAKLCGTMAPAALTQSLSQIRIKLADQNRYAQGEIAEQKAELQALSTRLGEQHEKVSRQKHEVQDWMTRRQEEIEQQAARLVAREQQLDEQESQFGLRDKQWQDERYGYQQEIRKLLRQLRRTEAVAA